MTTLEIILIIIAVIVVIALAAVVVYLFKSLYPSHRSIYRRATKDHDFLTNSYLSSVSQILREAARHRFNNKNNHR